MYHKIINNKWIILLILFGLVTPDYLKRFPITNLLARGIRLFSYFLILLQYIKDIRFHTNKLSNILLLILWLELLFSTLISDIASIYLYVVQMLEVVFFCFFLQVSATNNSVNSIQCIYWYFSLAILINTATVFIFPNALYPDSAGDMVCWFLGGDNYSYGFYVIASTFALLYCQYISKRVTLIAVLDWVSSFVFVFHNDIATGIFCQIIWLLLIIINRLKGFKKLLKAQYALYLMLFGFLFVVLSHELILAPIVRALGRNVTLTGRTTVWERTITLILKKPIFGYGICYGNIYASAIKIPRATMAHDWLLNLGFAGGILSVVLYISLVVSACRDGMPYRESPFYRYLVIGFVVIFIRAVTEGSYWPLYFIFPVLICYSKEFLSGLSSNSIYIKPSHIRFVIH